MQKTVQVATLEISHFILFCCVFGILERIPYIARQLCHFCKHQSLTKVQIFRTKKKKGEEERRALVGQRNVFK